MLGRSIKRGLVSFITITSLSMLVNINLNYNTLYAIAAECTDPIYNLNIQTGEKLMKFSMKDNVYKAIVNNNTGRVMILYDHSDKFESNDLEIVIDEAKDQINNLKCSKYIVDTNSPVIMIENLKIGLNTIRIKYKPTGKELYKIYIEYDKNFNDNKVGWLEEFGQRYYIDPYTRNKRIGWVKDNGKWYYLSSTGIMQTGWVLDGDDWYYLNSSGVLQTGWIQDDDGKFYYLNSDGSLKS
ncbi:N-acetylmuramoyl-L-alanine amidase family protein [Clostridium weizhouense]|uniref:Cell wall-binding protein n=1 Tax=Clostridium weizhouense TaxID=2859781 RepID=A0ABS7AQV9_9CLOT|nr:hypothetical protein [Clostridium weizhouense]MBW6410786.1 hypothetical protein [Clostridium weizhouense]